MIDPGSSHKHFAEMIAAGEVRLDLAEAALVIAQEEFPSLEVSPYLAQINALARRLGPQSNRTDGFSMIQALNRVLFEEDGYVGNQDDYYDPRNSFLNEVMDRKSGIPISLSILYMAVAQRAGLLVEGVSLPGHFIVRYCQDGQIHYIDPFHRGEFLTADECRDKVLRIYGERMPFRNEYLKSVSNFTVLSRLLYNLKNIYVQSKSYAKALSVIEKLVMLNPGKWEEVRDRAVVRYQLKSYSAALMDLEAYLQNVPESQDRQDLMKLEDLISRRLSEDKK